MTTEHLYPKDIERSVLGSLLLRGGSNLHLVRDTLNEADFHSDQNSNIYAWICECIDDGYPATPELLLDGKPDPVVRRFGGGSYIWQLGDNACIDGQLQYYATRISEAARLRSIRRLGEEILSMAGEGMHNSIEVQSHVENKLQEMLEVGTHKTVMTLGDDVEGALVELDHMLSGDTLAQFVPSGFPSFDQHYLGWPRGYPSYIGARAKIGKSMFLQGCALRQASLGLKVGVVSLEMPVRRFIYRLGATRSGVPFDEILRGNTSSEEVEQFQNGIRSLTKLQIHVDCKVKGLEPVLDSIRRLARIGCQVVWVDYWQLISHGKSVENPTAALDKIADALRDIAKMENIALIMLAQFNKGPDNRAVNGRRGIPMSIDWRGSERPFMDAGLAFGLYREFEYHHPRKLSGLEYEDDELSSMLQPFELLCLAARDVAKKRIEFWSQMNVGRVVDPLDKGFVDPNWTGRPDVR